MCSRSLTKPELTPGLTRSRPPPRGAGSLAHGGGSHQQFTLTTALSTTAVAWALRAVAACPSARHPRRRHRRRRRAAPLSLRRVRPRVCDRAAPRAVVAAVVPGTAAYDGAPGVATVVPPPPSPAGSAAAAASAARRTTARAAAARAQRRRAARRRASRRRRLCRRCAPPSPQSSRTTPPPHRRRAPPAHARARGRAVGRSPHTQRRRHGREAGCGGSLDCERPVLRISGPGGPYSGGMTLGNWEITSEARIWRVAPRSPRTARRRRARRSVAMRTRARRHRRRSRRRAARRRPRSR